ncbi:carboxymuconolactone decarboxylase family protein [Aliifodinibius sp. S!AR15-10]|uniref:carboxymuconolactone decarboxylase family protein n=1 Tax=Aliifodinibius sp. S!AR15-10 TaxID=2950437 RepID=UPI002857ACBF|nr:carboxymuconolactone decarboxylase family protein [Aliifodinibius sp. S!AR15-10]MDR8390024.1 carboxymuconolactone decarboxylase family protein [Aliifodinibius sp. S!AR15-10]
MNFTIYTTENAPKRSKSLLKSAKKSNGFLPNILGVMAESPAVLEGYLKLSKIVSRSDFSPQEKELAILAVSEENKCEYCTAVHSTALKKQLNADEGIVNAVFKGEELANPKLNILVNYVRKAVRSRGHVQEEDIQEFLKAGYSKQNVLEINLIIALMTISNYTNHLADTPLDEVYKSEKIELESA